MAGTLMNELFRTHSVPIDEYVQAILLPSSHLGQLKNYESGIYFTENTVQRNVYRLKKKIEEFIVRKFVTLG